MKERTAKDLKQFHKLVCERDDWTCQVCGKYYGYDHYFQGDINQYVMGHHIKTQGSSPEERLNINNGACIDVECHNKIHNGEIKL